MPSEEPLSPAAFHAHFATIKKVGRERTDASVIKLALKVQNLAREALARNSHTHDTPTNAVPGGPPSLISGQLRRAVDHEARTVAGQLVVRVGVRDSQRRPYPGRRRPGVIKQGATNATIGAALEMPQKRRGAAYPFLMPAYREGTAGHMSTIRASFEGADWKG